jgi:hypothetical protein
MLVVTGCGGTSVMPGGSQFETDENLKLVIGFLDKYLK